MATASRYDLAFNWTLRQRHPFTDTVREHARRLRIKVLCVRKQDGSVLRRRLDQGRLRVELFLNTQADGSHLDKPDMLLCRAMKASGALVVEDPDDSRIYADRTIVYEYLQRAGMTVPWYRILNSFNPKQRTMTAKDRTQLGDVWVAVPGKGLDPRRRLTSSARRISAALTRAGYRPGQKILIRREYKPVRYEDHQCRLRVWHLFGELLCCWVADNGAAQLISSNDLNCEYVVQALAQTRHCAHIFGLDWFMSEYIGVRIRSQRKLMIVEPPNALAAMGPGKAGLALLPNPIARTAARIITECAWRRSRGLPVASGVTARLTPLPT